MGQDSNTATGPRNHPSSDNRPAAPSCLGRARNVPKGHLGHTAKAPASLRLLGSRGLRAGWWWRDLNPIESRVGQRLPQNHAVVWPHGSQSFTPNFGQVCSKSDQRVASPEQGTGREFAERRNSRNAPGSSQPRLLTPTARAAVARSQADSPAPRRPRTPACRLPRFRASQLPEPISRLRPTRSICAASTQIGILDRKMWPWISHKESA